MCIHQLKYTRITAARGSPAMNRTNAHFVSIHSSCVILFQYSWKRWTFWSGFLLLLCTVSEIKNFGFSSWIWTQSVLKVFKARIISVFSKYLRSSAKPLPAPPPSPLLPTEIRYIFNMVSSGKRLIRRSGRNATSSAYTAEQARALDGR